MAKSNTDRIKDIITILDQFDERIQGMEKELNDNQEAVDQISSQRDASHSWHNEIRRVKDEAVEMGDEIKSLKDEIVQVREDIAGKINSFEIKKENIDKFFIKIFGEENEQGEMAGGLSKRLKQKETEVDAFLKKQEKRYVDLFNKIESLLPGATSIGLAESFHNQKKSYKESISQWKWIFVSALFGMFLIGIGVYLYGWFFSSGEVLSLEQTISNLITRIPFYFPFIWLAIFSSKQYRQNKRLEQEYAHKRSFGKILSRI